MKLMAKILLVFAGLVSLQFIAASVAKADAASENLENWDNEFADYSPYDSSINAVRGLVHLNAKDLLRNDFLDAGQNPDIYAGIAEACEKPSCTFDAPADLKSDSGIYYIVAYQEPEGRLKALATHPNMDKKNSDTSGVEGAAVKDKSGTQ